MSDSFEPQTIDLSASFVQLIRTALNNPKITLDKTGLKSYDANGSLVVAINADGTAQFGGGVVKLFAAPSGNFVSNNSIEWIRQSNGSVLAYIMGYDDTHNSEVDIVTNPSAGETGVISLDANSPTVNGTTVGIYGSDTSPLSRVMIDCNSQTSAAARKLLDDSGASDFLQTVNNLADLPSVTTARGSLGLGTAPSGAYLSASRSITGTGAQLMKADTKEPAPMDQTNLITSAGWVQYRCPATGLYLFSLRSTIETSAASNSIVADIYKNGAKLLTMDQVPSNGAAGNFYGLAGSYFVPCNAGDTLEAGFEVYAVSSTTLYGGYTYTGWQVVRWA